VCAKTGCTLKYASISSIYVCAKMVCTLKFNQLKVNMYKYHLYIDVIKTGFTFKLNPFRVCKLAQKRVVLCNIIIVVLFLFFKEINVEVDCKQTSMWQ
jgi:hypothetical protein